MDPHRQLTELAVAAGRRLQSDETGFLHLGDVIPVVDNFLFALALLRSLTKEAMSEAREIITRLLPFEAEEGFPSALHQYPQGNPRLARPLKPILSFMLDTFPLALGAQLTSELEALSARLGEQEPYPRDRLTEGVVRDIHGPTGLYAGPPSGEQQRGLEPAVTFLDLQIAAASGHFAKRTLEPQRVHLQGALIRPEQKKLELTEGPSWAYGAGEALRLVWGDRQLTRTLLLPGVKGVREVGAQLQMELTEPKLFLPLVEGLTIRVNGQTATCFALGDLIQVSDGAFNMDLRFEGEGRCTGHIHRGNRPGQLLAKGGGRFDAYDWHIFLRGGEKLRLNMEVMDGSPRQIKDRPTE